MLDSPVCGTVGRSTPPPIQLKWGKSSGSGTGSILNGSLPSSGPNLRINYEPGEGSITVEILHDGQIIPGYEAENCDRLTGNDLDKIVI
jgi:hypothetical protein